MDLTVLSKVFVNPRKERELKFHYILSSYTEQ